jgi:restriction system protein
LKKAGLLHAPRRAHIQISKRGLEVVASKPARVDVSFLKKFPEFVAFQQTKGTRPEKVETEIENQESGNQKTPLESMEAGYQNLRHELADELLEKVKESSPMFFERLVVELVVKMGYGGSLMDAGRAIGKSGDEGIDGIIKEDKLGLDAIYLQAKRWKDTVVGRPSVQQFAGALAGQGAQKGIFITTSNFTEDARNFVAKVNSKIVLIDGEQLANLMIDHGVGVNTTVTYEIKRVDSDYFAEGE